jgi:sulfite reductase alpha subunit
LGTKTSELEPIFSKLTKAGFDLGGSGSCVRTPSCCVGPSRCEWACYDTMALTYDLTMTYQDSIHRPAFPYKFKFKMSGCPNDCVASIARADLSVIGIWKDAIQINQDAVQEYAKKINIQADVIGNCPGKCMEWDGKKLHINDSFCRKCMHCINVMPKALKPGKEKGAAILVGSKAPIMQGALLSSVFIPFMKLVPPYKELKDFIDKMLDFWCEEGKNRERMGEFIQRIGLGNFLEKIGLDPIPSMVSAPRDNPYVFYEEYYEEDEQK